MKRPVEKLAVFAGLSIFVIISAGNAAAQFQGFWLDIGEYHNVYAESGARHDHEASLPSGMQYPAILRNSDHAFARAFWIGVQDWTNPDGQHHDYYVSRIGGKEPGVEFSSPVDTRIISRTQDTEVYVDDSLTFGKEAVVDEVDPGIPSDRMIVNVFNVDVGVTVTRTIYAYVNQFHDNYHVIEYEYCNTGNTDADSEIELPNQTLNETYFYHMHRWRGSGQAAWTGTNGQVWGKFNMIDVVGDGHEDYPVDFTAIYTWIGYDPHASLEFNNLGSPLWTASPQWHATTDTVGRLAGGTFVGRTFLHVDQGVDDEAYVRCTPATSDNCQPHTLSWLDQDHPLAGESESNSNYYKQAILGLVHTSGPSRNYPHYADQVEFIGEFWDPTTSAAEGYGTVAQGGYSPTEAVGPYDMHVGDCVNHVIAEGVAGLSYNASTHIGRRYKRSGGNDYNSIFYDADGDERRNEAAFNYETIGLPHYQGNGCTTCPEQGSELLTKNQWVMTARDSIFQMFFRAHDLYEASSGMTTYPVPEAPYAPIRFHVDGRPDAIELSWTPHPAGGPAIDHWELYRATGFVDNLLMATGEFRTEATAHVLEQLVTGYECIAGCENTPELPLDQTSFLDESAARDTDYFYYLIAVGEAQDDDPLAIHGTPGAVPLTSSRYLTQTYRPTTPTGPTAVDDPASPPPTFALHANYPDPFSDVTTIAFDLADAAAVELSVYDVFGRRVRVLARGVRRAGRHQVVFDAADLANGVYFYRLHAGGREDAKAMLLAR